MKEIVKKGIKAQSILISVLLIIVLHTSGQSYQAVIQSDSTSWDVAHMELFGIMMGTMFTKSYPDSIYSNVFMSNFNYPPIYWGKVREDAISGKLWYIDIYGNDEKIIMDMDLIVGDTFQIKPNHYSTVDSVYYKNNRKIIRFDLETRWDEAVKFIEGVGPNISITYPLDDYDGFYVSCKYNTDSLIYINSNPNFIDCEPDLSAINEISFREEIIIYPNPFTETLNIKLENCLKNYTGKLQFNLYNSMGFRIKNGIMPKSKSIELSDLKSGFYYIHLLSDNEIIHKQSVLKQ